MMTFETDLAAVREVEVRFLRHRCRLLAIRAALLKELVRDLVTDPHNPEIVYRARILLADGTEERT